jgi:hypothetical protein
MADAAELVVATAEVKGGRLFIRNRRAFDEQVAQLREGWQLEVTIKRLRATRSLEQNAFYWGVVVQLLSEHTGYTPDEIHDLLKMKFIPKRMAFADGNGEVVDQYVLGGSTRKMNKLEFGEYIAAIQQWAAEELDLVIPDPNQDEAVVHERADRSSRPKWYRAKRRQEAEVFDGV